MSLVAARGSDDDGQARAFSAFFTFSPMPRRVRGAPDGLVAVVEDLVTALR